MKQVKLVTNPSDGSVFAWLIVNYKTAAQLFHLNLVELYALYEDDTEDIIDSEDKLRYCVSAGLHICVGLGTVSNAV